MEPRRSRRPATTPAPAVGWVLHGRSRPCARSSTNSPPIRLLAEESETCERSKEDAAQPGRASYLPTTFARYTSAAICLSRSSSASVAEIATLLRDITVCDPAIGSGAFPVGMMTEIVRARVALTPYFNDVAERTPYYFKRHAIQSVSMARTSTSAPSQSRSCGSGSRSSWMRTTCSTSNRGRTLTTKSSSGTLWWAWRNTYLTTSSSGGWKPLL
jgi:hypothetical protein